MDQLVFRLVERWGCSIGDACRCILGVGVTEELTLEELLGFPPLVTVPEAEVVVAQEDVEFRRYVTERWFLG